MKVTIIDYTKNAKELLMFAKNTRLKMSPDGLSEIMDMPEEEKQKEVNYVFGTISGPLEFVDYTVMIEGVTRAFTHQLVRHRVGTSFAQQSMRAVSMQDFECLATGLCAEGQIGSDIYKKTINRIRASYSNLIDIGVSEEDARGLLPTNVLTNILMKVNLRSLATMMEQRLCNRAQEEFRNVMAEIKSQVQLLHPWAEPLLQCYCDKNKKCFFKNGKGCGKYE